MAQSDSRTTHTATIAAAGSLSAAVKLGGGQLVGIISPGTFDANTTNLQFHVSIDGTNYFLLKDMNAAAPVIAIVAATNAHRAHWFGEQFRGFNYVKVGTYRTDASTVQTQTAEKVFTLITR